MYIVFNTELQCDCQLHNIKGFLIILDDKVETLGTYIVFMQLYNEVIKMEISNCRMHVLGKSFHLRLFCCIFNTHFYSNTPEFKKCAQFPCLCGEDKKFLLSWATS